MGMMWKSPKVKTAPCGKESGKVETNVTGTQTNLAGVGELPVHFTTKTKGKKGKGS